jgi:hypothetical protein
MGNLKLLKILKKLEELCKVCVVVHGGKIMLKCKIMFHTSL